MPKFPYLIPTLLCLSTAMLSACNDDNTNSTATNAESSVVETPIPITETEQSAPVLAAADDECDVENFQLLDFTPWQRENGYWVGEYTLLGADGTPQVSSRWPYRYDNYQGFIHLEVLGNAIKQRNVFLYPPKLAELCDETTVALGNGICGINGNEKIFSADQKASDCSGNISGPFESFGMTLDTKTTLIGDDSVLYQVRMPDGSIMQNQLTTLPPNDTRVRTAQGFFSGSPTYASYYRERKVTKTEFFQLLAEARTEYNILATDHCGYDNTNQPSQTTCDDHFGLDLSTD
ncbi:hypothetical protein C0W96_08770 [Photobacterium kishitanii]|uniref:hypothetical protein n=1 Tax=Photobacterium kishitanii TaxID=318456 RepID=UPI0005D3BED3|nr:hypothetical protein [Photobacterium kishitanii]PSV06542.1 hypothetical protein C0W96_08770 [Photobacterium kishitanii]PSV77425.1 hypothetical protein C0W29_02770 [Photobacterium kishitanii]